MSESQFPEKELTLVTGANGFIGRRLLGPDDRALVRERQAGNDRAAIGDLLVPDSLSRACEGVHTVFHCAGHAHAFLSSDSDAHWRINFEGTKNLLHAAGKAGVRSLVFLSSVKAMGEPGEQCVDEDFSEPPVTPYGKAKRAAEQEVLNAGAQYGMHVVNLRLSMVYGKGGRGNLERMARGIQRGWFPTLPETHNRRSMVHVSDVVSAIHCVAKAPLANGKTYIVSDPQPYSGREIHDQICHILGKARGAWPIPAWGLRASGWVGDVLSAVFGKSFPLSSEVVSRLLDSAWYSPEKIKRELGWVAQTGLSKGLLEMLENEAVV